LQHLDWARRLDVAFQPERWLSDETRPKQFSTFGGGSHLCIGMHLAIAEVGLAAGAAPPALYHPPDDRAAIGMGWQHSLVRHHIQRLARWPGPTRIVPLHPSALPAATPAPPPQVKLVLLSLLRRYEWRVLDRGVLAKCVMFPGPTPAKGTDVLELTPKPLLG
jgi:hypothetical protein